MSSSEQHLQVLQDLLQELPEGILYVYCLDRGATTRRLSSGDTLSMVLVAPSERGARAMAADACPNPEGSWDECPCTRVGVALPPTEPGVLLVDCL